MRRLEWLSIGMTCMLTAAILRVDAAAVAAVSSNPEKGHGGQGPLIAILQPASPLRVNATDFRVQVLVAAHRADAQRTFAFNGAAVAGRNAGVIERVDVAIDGQWVLSRSAAPCRRQFVLDEVVSIAALADGPHQLDVMAVQRGRRAAATARITFTIDRSLPMPQRNRIEDAATPAPFACLSARDRDDDEDDEGPAPLPPAVHGRLVLGAQSDGIDLSSDRVIVSAGGLLRVYEPGSFRCRPSNVCRIDSRFDPFLQRVVFERRGAGVWRFRLVGGPQWPPDAVVHLRVGNDWGGIDTATNGRVASTRLLLDEARAVAGVIGPEGGRVETRDAHGTVIAVDVPAGALTEPTPISATPLEASPLISSDSADPYGVDLQPHGLQFARPVSLTFDFAESTLPLTAATSIYLVTSPMTKLPVPTRVEGTRVIAALPHFSPWQPGVPNGALTDRVAWAAAVLTASTPLNEAEIQSLLGIVADQQLAGCTTDCLDLAAVAARVDASIDAMAAPFCADPVAYASRATVQRMLALEQLSQQAGGSVPGLLACAHQMIGVLIGRVDPTAVASASPTEFALAEAKALSDAARAFRFADLSEIATAKLADGLRGLGNRVVTAVQAAAGSTNEAQVKQQALQELQQAHIWVTTIAPEVLTVDASLSDFLQAAIAGLSTTASFTFSPAPTPWFESFCGPSASLGFAIIWERYLNPWWADSTRVCGSAASRAGIEIAVAARQSGNTFVVDFHGTGRFLGPGSGWEAYVDASYDLTFSGPGILTLVADPPPYPWDAESVAIGLGAVQPPATANDDPSGFSIGGVGIDGTCGGSAGCEQTFRVGANTRFRLRIEGWMRDVEDDEGRDFSFTSSPVRAIFTPGVFGSPNQTPIAIPGTFQTPVDTPLALHLDGDDLERDPLSFTIVDGPGRGRLIGVGPDLIYEPEEGFQGFDSFTFTVSDGRATSEPATIRVQVGSGGGES